MLTKLRIVLVTLLLGCISLPAQARDDDNGRGQNRQDRHDRGAQQRDSRGLDRAAGQARRETGGRVLSADENGDSGYRVKILTPDGRVRTVTVDGEDDERQRR